MKVKLHDGTSVTCEPEPLGQGGAGRVLRTADGQHAIKLFHRPAPELEQALPLIIGEHRHIAEAEWAALYRWPDAIVVEPGLGARMPLIGAELHELSGLLLREGLASRPPAWRSWRLRVTIAQAIAAAMARLHGSGLAFPELAPRNVWVDPESGQVTLIGMEGLVVPGVEPPQGLGTPGYLAPEVLVKQALPSETTDRHSLAVLLHQLLLYHHPLRGPRVRSSDPEESDRLALGPEGLFIDHPSDPSNRPVDEEGAGFWPTRILGSQLVDLFGRAFVAGLRSPAARPTAAEWGDALTRLADRVVACSSASCSEGGFPLSDGVAPVCPWCRTPLELRDHTPVLHLYQEHGAAHYEPEPSWWIAGTEGRKLYPWHTAKGIAVAVAVERRPMAEVEYNDGIWSLRNHGLAELRVIRNGRADRVVPIGDAVTLHDALALLLAPSPRGRAIVVSRFEH